MRDAASNATIEDTTYGYADSGDSPAYMLSGTTRTTYVRGPSGSLVTYTGTTPSYPLANLHGDIIGTTDTNGAYTAVPLTDEYGVGTTPDTRLGWHGNDQRYTTSTNLGLIRMGVRLYDPKLGRFLQVDPVEGGSCNDYDFVCGDSVNYADVSGEAMNSAEAAYCKASVRQLARCAAAYRLSVLAINTTKRIFGHNLEDTVANAFQHAYWSALMTIHFGASIAKGFGDRHEARLSTVQERRTPGLYERRRAMDLANNALGRTIGQWARNHNDALQALLSSYDLLGLDGRRFRGYPG